MLNDENVTLPELPPFDDAGFNNIVVTTDEVESVFKALPICDGVNNCILGELAHMLSTPLWSLFNQSLSLGIVPNIMCVLLRRAVMK